MTARNYNNNNKASMDRICDLIAAVGSLIWAVSNELFIAVKTKSFPLAKCLIPTIIFCIIRISRLDEHIYAAWGMRSLFLKYEFFYWLYYILGLTSGIISYGLIRTWRAYRIKSELKRTFEGIGLKNSFGELPGFVSDYPIDNANRVLKLRRNYISIEEFKQKEKSIAGALNVHVDDIEETREDGTVDVIYSPKGMPKLFVADRLKSFSDFSFSVGKTRAKELTASFSKFPHWLVGGESDGGKSTFLRQLIATVYLNNENVEFLLIDLKGNLEFQYFENLPRITICKDVPQAVTELTKFKDKVKQRFTELGEVGAKDLESYQRIRKEKMASRIAHTIVPKQLSRVVIVIDEAAEIFLVSHKTKSQDVRSAREVISQIARQGRALGFNLVFSTQRPDVYAIDSQVKANLTSIIAYRTANSESSKTILGNGRASQLPKIPGRAIWKVGGEMTEVQTPFLDVPQLNAILEPLKVKVEPPPSEKKATDSEKRAPASKVKTELGEGDTKEAAP